MALLVQKFGGTSLATIDKIKNVAAKIQKSLLAQNQIAVVVSAMAGETNQLINLVNTINQDADDENYDIIISSAEQVSAGLLAMSLSQLNIKTKVYLGWQIPIITDDNFSDANILSIKTDKILADIEFGITPIICGFQGVSRNNKITTIGRGGSDLTAVTVAHAIHANMCEIFSDVEGVYNIDPNISMHAKLIDKIDYKYMFEMSINGAKILQNKSVEFAMKNDVAIRAASTFTDNYGTIVGNFKPLENAAIAGSFVNNLIQYHLFDEKITNILYDNNIVYDVINTACNAETVCNAKAHEAAGGTIIFDKKDIKSINKLLKKHALKGAIKIKLLQNPISKFVFFGDMTDEVIKTIEANIHKENIDILNKNETPSKENHGEKCKISYLIDSCNLQKIINIFHTIC